MPHAPVAKSELFARLAEGHAARVTVVTPNLRLARELAREFDAGQVAKGLKVWETADILPLAAFVERLYEDALYSELAAKLPLLLAPQQERALWEAAIRASRWGETLLALPQSAADAARAWELAHAWRIDGALGAFPGSDDAKAFAEWAAEVAKRCAKEGHTDRARLADVVAPLLPEGALRKPRLLVAYAFDVVTPQQRDFLEACAKAGIELATSERKPPRSGRARSWKAAPRASPSSSPSSSAGAGKSCASSRACCGPITTCRDERRSHCLSTSPWALPSATGRSQERHSRSSSWPRTRSPSNRLRASSAPRTSPGRRGRWHRVRFSTRLCGEAPRRN